MIHCLCGQHHSSCSADGFFCLRTTITVSWNNFLKLVLFMMALKMDGVLTHTGPKLFPVYVELKQVKHVCDVYFKFQFCFVFLLSGILSRSP